MKPDVRIKLSIMMFLQYAVWGSWAVSIGGYLAKTLHFTGVQIGSIYSTTAIAAMISPLFIGYIADRLLSTEYVIALLHLIGAALLGVAAYATTFEQLYPVMVAYSICYMPTLALTNAISFANIGDPEKDFPLIRVWGTLGWIAVGLLVGFVLDVPAGTSNEPILLAAGTSALLGLFSLLLPHTPPRGVAAAAAVTDNRASVMQLLRDPSFLVFVICSFLICIPLSFYYGFAYTFLTDISAPAPAALQTIGQMSEVGFMAAMPFFIVRLGVKRMLMIGMLAWVIRYFCFGSLSLPLIIFGLFLHGVCYDFFFVASQIYVDTSVTASQRASAQSFIAFVMMGVGMFVGSYAGGVTVDAYPGPIMIQGNTVTSAGATPLKAPVLTVKTHVTEETARLSLSERFGQAFGRFSQMFSTATAPTTLAGFAVDAGLVQADGTLLLTEVPEKVELTDDKSGTKTVFDGPVVVAALKKVDQDGNGIITTVEVGNAQHDWSSIWLWPALGALATCIVFWIGFRNPRSREAEGKPA